MCTLTFIPLSSDQLVMTQNRDEFANRAKPGIIRRTMGNKSVMFPQDNGAGGTWMATSDHDQIVCLLNGAFVKHRHLPPYRRSRGLVVLDFLESEYPLLFFRDYDLSDIEPFTMVVYNDGKLYEWRWDEQQRHLTIKDPHQKHIWASCTLYTPEQQDKRSEWFDAWQSKNLEIDQSAILDFHLHAGDGDPYYNLVMNRMDIVMTTSITSIHRTNQVIDLIHQDLINDESIKQQITQVNGKGRQLSRD